MQTDPLAEAFDEQFAIVFARSPAGPRQSLVTAPGTSSIAAGIAMIESGVGAGREDAPVPVGMSPRCPEPTLRAMLALPSRRSSARAMICRYMSRISIAATQIRNNMPAHQPADRSVVRQSGAGASALRTLLEDAPDDLHHRRATIDDAGGSAGATRSIDDRVFHSIGAIRCSFSVARRLDAGCGDFKVSISGRR